MSGVTSYDTLDSPARSSRMRMSISVSLKLELTKSRETVLGSLTASGVSTLDEPVRSSRQELALETGESPIAGSRSARGTSVRAS